MYHPGHYLRMTNRFDRFLIKGQAERTERLFVVDATDDPIDQVDIASGRAERQVIPEAQTKYETALQELGLEQITELAEGFAYPTFDEWIAYRIQHHRSTKFFPSMLKTRDNRVLFCKTQVSPNPHALAGLAVEAERLQHLVPGVTAPRFVRYIPPSEGRLAMLMTEALTMEEAAPGVAEDWTEAHARSAATQIKQMESKVVEATDAITLAHNLLQFFKPLGVTIPDNIVRRIENELTAHQDIVQPVFVHGDPNLKNLLLGVQDDTVYFTDWEYRGAGLASQDATIIWRQLKHLPVGQAFLEAYLREADGSLNELRQRQMLLTVTTESIVGHAWSNFDNIRNGIGVDIPITFPDVDQLREKLKQLDSL